MPDMSKEDLKKFGQDCGEAGAKKALASIGLDDEYAIHDVHDLRNFLKSWQMMRKTALKVIARRLTDVLLLSAIIVLAIKAGALKIVGQ